jgi:hypothetical protein
MTIFGRSLCVLPPAWILFMIRKGHALRATRVLVATEPRMYGEALAFHLKKHRPRAEVSLLGPSEDVGAEVERARPGPLLVVANRVPLAAKEEGTAFWVEVAEARGGVPMGAEVSADGYSRSVRELSNEHVLAALDRAEEILGQGLADGGAGPVQVRRGGKAAQ